MVNARAKTETSQLIARVQRSFVAESTVSKVEESIQEEKSSVENDSQVTNSKETNVPRKGVRR